MKHSVPIIRCHKDQQIALTFENKNFELEKMEIFRVH